MGPGVVLPLKWRARFNGQVRAVFDIVAPQPGNSYRVVAGGRQEDLERVLARAADSDSEVFFDNDNHGYYNPQSYGGSGGGDWELHECSADGPGEDSAISGMDVNGTWGFVFWETLRDICDDEYPEYDWETAARRNTVHEIGHQFDDVHDESFTGYIMDMSPHPARGDAFSESSLFGIRNTDHP